MLVIKINCFAQIELTTAMAQFHHGRMSVAEQTRRAPQYMPELRRDGSLAQVGGVLGIPGTG